MNKCIPNELDIDFIFPCGDENQDWKNFGELIRKVSAQVAFLKGYTNLAMVYINDRGYEGYIIEPILNLLDDIFIEYISGSINNIDSLRDIVNDAVILTIDIWKRSFFYDEEGIRANEGTWHRF